MINLRNFSTVKDRRGMLEKELKASLRHTGIFSLDEARASTRNCENMVGIAQVPMGVAGPLAVKDQKEKVRNYYVPLATTEAALVASVNRGAKAINKSGGATSLVQRIGTTRGPVFKVKNADEVIKLKGFITRYFKTLVEVAAGTSGHLKLLSSNVLPVGQYVFVRFYFDTGDAMGMNMATIATQAIVDRIEKETGIKCLTVAGNFDIDKKPAWLNAIGFRGWSVRSEVVVTEEILEKVLKTTASKIHEIWLAKCMIGSAVAGSMGFNAHYANVIAALFIATGQDVAHVVEGSMGITTTEVRDRDLYVSIHLPALMIGTVGGGTTLATQQEALRLMGVAGTGKVAEFASIAGAAVLAGEISLLASLAEGSLACVHQSLSRGK